MTCVKEPGWACPLIRCEIAPCLAPATDGHSPTDDSGDRGQDDSDAIGAET